MKTTLNELRSLVKQVLKENDDQQKIVDIIWSGEVELGLQLLKSLRPRIIPTKFLMENFGELLKLAQLPFSKSGLAQLVNLKKLDVLNGNLEFLPESIGNLTQLETLEISHNHLTTIPQNIIDRLKNLKFLYIHNNNLTSLPDNIGQLTQLIGIDLSDNNLKSLPDSIGQLTQLVGMNIKNNRIPRETIFKLKQMLPNCVIHQ